MPALVRQPAATLATACELTHVERDPIDFGRIASEHQGYVAALRDGGRPVIELPALPQHPDSVFVEDAAVVVGPVAILTRPGVASREAEPQFLEASLRALGLDVLALSPPARLDGGDVLRIGRRFYVGQGTRSDASGHAAFADCMRSLGFDTFAVPTGRSLHLKTAVTALDDETVLLNPVWVDRQAFDGLRVLEIDPSEPFAANALRLDDRLLVNAAFPSTRQRIEAHARGQGLRVEAVELREFGRAEAGLTCLSLVWT
jgi:dimethylargininase